MYDSDEVRDAVRRDALAVFTQRTGAFQGFADLPPVEVATINEALVAEGNPWQRALRGYLEELADRPADTPLDRLRMIAEAIITWFREAAGKMLDACQPYLDRLREIADAVLERVCDFAEAIGVVRAQEPEPFAWQRRPRSPQLRPVKLVDAVAAARSPAMIMRARIRGGRRA